MLAFEIVLVLAFGLVIVFGSVLVLMANVKWVHFH